MEENFSLIGLEIVKDDIEEDQKNLTFEVGSNDDEAKWTVGFK